MLKAISSTIYLSLPGSSHYTFFPTLTDAEIFLNDLHPDVRAKITVFEDVSYSFIEEDLKK